MDLDGLSFDLEDIIVKLLWWVVKIVLILLVVPVVLVVVGLVGLVELVIRLVTRRPWSIDGFANDGSIVRWTEPGMRRAAERRDAIRAGLAAGAAPQGGDIRSLPG